MATVLALAAVLTGGAYMWLSWTPLIVFTWVFAFLWLLVIFSGGRKDKHRGRHG